VTLVRLDRGAQLEMNRLVAREQRQVAVGGGAGEDLDVTLVRISDIVIAQIARS